MSFIISRGYAEVQILKNKWIWPFQLLEHFDMHLSIFWKKKKKKTQKDITHIHMLKKSADTLDIIFLFVT